LEARRRRISFLATAVRGLELEGVHLLHGRAESLIDSEPGLRGAFDTVVTRAAGPPGLILPLALAFLKAGGRFIASGPPAEKPAPSLPQDTPYRWESILPPGGGRSRRFLIVEKT
jgi:16S rRNA G527 N7-methylase RsmG